MAQEQLRVLFVEDSADDAELLAREIRRAGFALRWTRVETAETLAVALAGDTWDALIADYSMPSFGALDALRMVQERGLDLPFIIVSGVITEETAVEAMRKGAHDFLLKEHLARLGPALSRELRETALRRERRRVEEELNALKERSAAELQRSRDELEVVLRGVAEGVIAEDSSGRLVYVNEAAVAAYRVESAAALLATTEQDRLELFEFTDEAGRPFPPGQMPGPAALAQGRTIETVVRARDRRRGEERWYLVTATPIFDERRQTWVAITIFRDVTERRAAEIDARFLSDASAALAGSLDPASTVAILARVPVPHLADWCVAELPDPEHPERGLVSIICQPEEDTAAARELRSRTPVAGRSVLGARELLCEEGAVLWSEVPSERVPMLRPRSLVAVPLRARGHWIGALCLLSTRSGRRFGPRDLELAEEIGRRGSLAIENARLYQQSRQAVALRDEFLSVASHELRTPLTTLTLLLQRLQRLPADLSRPDTAARAHDSVDRAVKQAHRLAALIDNLLDVSRVTFGKLTLRREPFDIGELVREVVERHAEDALRAGCAVEVHAPTGLLGSWDHLRVEQIVTNLLSNALKYGPGRPVVVEVEGLPSEVRLRVIDHGIGIRPDDLSRIFGRFERAVSLSHYGGLGLGLYIVQQIVTAHGGSVRVTSTPGSGATFEVRLPSVEPSLERYRNTTDQSAVQH